MYLMNFLCATFADQLSKACQEILKEMWAGSKYKAAELRLISDFASALRPLAIEANHENYMTCTQPGLTADIRTIEGEIKLFITEHNIPKERSDFLMFCAADMHPDVVEHMPLLKEKNVEHLLKSMTGNGVMSMLYTESICLPISADAKKFISQMNDLAHYYRKQPAAAKETVPA